MMLNSEDIAKALRLGQKQSAAGLTIVPLPCIPALLERGGTSVDFRLGRWFKSFRQTRVESVSLVAAVGGGYDARLSRTRQHFVPFGEKFVLHPGRFVLGVTLEWLRLPATMSGYVTGKSSLGRHGLIIETAAGIHPGFSGCLTLELANVGEVPLAIYPGMPVCQIFLHRIKAVKRAAAGQFSGSRKPILAPPKPDDVFEKIRGG
jgi:dCTP deaminase